MLPFSDTKPTTIRKLMVDFTTFTPWRCTTSGSWGVAACSLFCTCTWAMSGLVPALKVSVMLTLPAESEVDDM